MLADQYRQLISASAEVANQDQQGNPGSQLSITKLGSGSYGQVFLVESTTTTTSGLTS